MDADLTDKIYKKWNEIWNNMPGDAHVCNSPDLSDLVASPAVYISAFQTSQIYNAMQLITQYIWTY